MHYVPHTTQDNNSRSQYQTIIYGADSVERPDSLCCNFLQLFISRPIHERSVSLPIRCMLIDSLGASQVVIIIYTSHSPSANAIYKYIYYREIIGLAEQSPPSDADSLSLFVIPSRSSFPTRRSTAHKDLGSTTWYQTQSQRHHLPHLRLHPHH